MPDGRVKVWVPGVYDPQFEADGNEDFLPNAELMMPIFAKSINQSGWFCCPDVGAIVYVRFLNGDANYPLVVGTQLNAVPGFGKAMWNKAMKKKKYVKQILKNGVAEISMDETGNIELTVQSMEGGAEDNGSMKECRITLDRSNVNNRIVLDADDIVINGRNILINGFNLVLDAKNKLDMHGRGNHISAEAPSVFISANNGQGPNAVVLKGSSGVLTV